MDDRSMSSLNPFVFFRIFSLTIKKIVAVTHLHFGDLLWLFSFFYFFYITCNKCTWMRLGRPRELHQHYLFEHCSWCWKWWSLTIQTTGSQRLYNLKAIIIIKKNNERQLHWLSLHIRKRYFFYSALSRCFDAVFLRTILKFFNRLRSEFILD